MKSKLIKWYKDSKEMKRNKAKKKFENAKIKPKESLFLFSTRLEHLFKTAFPTHRIQESKTITSRFLGSIPKTVRNEIKAQMMSYKLKKQETNMELYTA